LLGQRDVRFGFRDAPGEFPADVVFRFKRADPLLAFVPPHPGGTVLNETIVAFNRLLAFVVKTLPDSLEERKAVLKEIFDLMPAQHRLRLQISELLNALEIHEQHQMKLALDFKNQPLPPNGDGDGDGDGEPKGI
jgi:hypothetical protein